MIPDANRARRILASMDPEVAKRLIGLLPQRIVVPVAPVTPGQAVVATGQEPLIESASTGALELGSRSAISMTRSVSGPLVRAGEPNRNGALFLVEDLKFGLTSIAGQPITVNHGEFAVGWIGTAEMQSQPDLGDFVNIDAPIWAQRFPTIWGQVEKAHAEGQAFFSMECVPSKVGCMGCGVEAATLDSACDHIIKRSAARRQISPTFIGAALVLPPEKPGWPDARLHMSQ